MSARAGLVCLLVLAAIALPAAAQSADASEQRVAPDADRLLGQMKRDAEAVITGQHFSYDPTGRRDPFEPLVKSERKAKGKRPKGIAGMLISEIDLKGVVLDREGKPAALFRGSDNRGYTVRVGDVVYDGRVIAIDPVKGEVVFRQQVDDPRRIKPYRDVTKRLRPTKEEGEFTEEEGA
ncbi:MAG: hypothetical protein D6718_00440 [Acidobacteria bacterium]|nr:MAG: hypothetical protein D6718_00440 [Acidobacteriota bacterium]